MDTAAKTSEDTASTSLHIKGTPTASQETNCIPNNQNTAKTSIPSTSAQLKRRSFRRFLAISRRDYPELARHYWRAQRLWSPSYYAGTNGGAPLDTLKRYIENQNRPE